MLCSCAAGGLRAAAAACSRGSRAPAFSSALRLASGAPAAAAAAAASAAGAGSAPAPARALVSTFRLRKVRQWAEAAPYITSLELAFDPALDGTAGVKELWRQSRGRAVRAANPRYTVAMASAEGGTPARLRVVYADGRKADVPAQGLSLPDLIDALLEPTEAMRDKEDAVEMEKN